MANEDISNPTQSLFSRRGNPTREKFIKICNQFYNVFRPRRGRAGPGGRRAGMSVFASVIPPHGQSRITAQVHDSIEQSVDHLITIKHAETIVMWYKSITFSNG